MRALSRTVSALALVSLAALFGVGFLVNSARAQVEEQDLTARARVFPGAGPGLRALRRGPDGRYYILSSTSATVAVYSPEGVLSGQVPKVPTKKSAVVSGEGLDVDASGRVYVADHGANAIKIYAPDGGLLNTIPVDAPLSVAAFPNGEIAVTSEHSEKLVNVYDAQGMKIRDFGQVPEMADRPDLNRLVSVGRVIRDADDHLFYGFTYFPEPRVQRYDLSGRASLEVLLNTLDYQPDAQATRREIAREDGTDKPPYLRPIIDAFGVDPRSEEVWIAMGDELVQCDNEGNRRGDYRTYTSEGNRVQPISILIESNRILLAADPIGVYDFARPPRPATQSTEPAGADTH